MVMDRAAFAEEKAQRGNPEFCSEFNFMSFQMHHLM